MKQWRCKICGYIHVGEAPPEKCPVCGAGPESFEEIGNQASSDTYLSESVSDLAVNRGQIQGALFQIPCGLFVISTSAHGKNNGMINNTVFQITDQPLQILLGMDKSHLTTGLIEKNLSFAVLFLRPDQIQLVKRFGFQSGRETDKFEGITWHAGETGVPILDDCGGYLECRVQPEKIWDAGTHRVFLAEVLSSVFQPGVQLLNYQEYRSRKAELWVAENG